MKNILIKTGFIFISIFIFTASNAAADSPIERMDNRAPEIIDLKAKGIIGENNKGYIEFVGDAREKQALVDAENADRKLVFSEIAKKNSVSIEEVGSQYARKRTENAGAGEWLQNESGEWYQK